ncbi:MAG: hypothetical protein FJ137_03440 [Deltaproteobacteria bacterium]|nr:hypothetical protein [Deltaproteobacteria bacterium]
MTDDADDLIELYAAANAIEADRLVLLLADDGVEALARATTMSSFPASGQQLILVRGVDRARARTTIDNARREGVIADGGDWLGR